MSDNSGWVGRTAILIGLAASAVTVLTYLGIHYANTNPPGSIPSMSSPSTKAAYIAAADQVCNNALRREGSGYP